ncbi:MAG: hypothetical protein R2708_28995, partial [Vicinamibacterales bacterium]
MRIQQICLTLLSVCALGTPPLLAAGGDQQAPSRLPAPSGPGVSGSANGAAPAQPARRAVRAGRATAPRSRGLLAVNGLFQPTTTSFADRQELSYFREPASYSGAYDIDSGIGVDIGGFARLWRNLGAGVSVSQLSRKGEAAFTGSYPHPFFFSRLRQADTSATGLDRSETGVHVSAAFLVPSNGRLHLVLFAGPSFFSMTQDVVNDITVTEAYPYDTVTIG